MKIFVGRAGVRSGWRLAAFAALVFVLSLIGESLAAPFVRGVPGWQIPGAIVPQALAVGETVLLLVALISTAVLAKFEKRPVWSYGFQNRGDAGRRYGEGLMLGVLAFGILGACMYVFGGFRINGFNLHGGELLLYPALWLGAMLLVGFAEEMLFRGYGLYALARGLGFWPAALIMTMLFGLAHIGKTGENPVDIASIVCFGLFLCFTLWRTGSLWLAAGFHSAVDYMQFFVIGTRNGSDIPIGHLLNASFLGPAWINGGPLGSEASYFVFPIIAVLAVVVHFLHPRVRFSDSSEGGAEAY